MGKLKLFALDKDDLDVISAHLQDAVAQVGDLRWLPGEKRFVMIVNRFDWTEAGGRRGEHHRRRTALHFARVNAVRRRAVRQDAPQAVLNLLAIRFEEIDSPGGTVDLVFSAGAMIRLEVECLEASLSDLGPAWTTESVPSHDTETSENPTETRESRTGEGA